MELAPTPVNEPEGVEVGFAESEPPGVELGAVVVVVVVGAVAVGAVVVVVGAALTVFFAAVGLEDPHAVAITPAAMSTVAMSTELGMR